MPAYAYVTFTLMFLVYRESMKDKPVPRHVVEYVVIWVIISLAELGYMLQRAS